MEYRLSEIAHAVGGVLCGEDRMVRDVVTDSRVSVGADSLFVAMQGKNHDSHNFIAQMHGRGVAAFLVERETQATNCDSLSYIIVENSIAALQRLAKHHRSRFMGRVVGITGSNGKTTIKEWVAQLAPSSIKVFRSPRSYNSQLGVALSLLMIEGDEDLAIIEAGISRPDEMARLEEMIDPDIVIISAIGEAHQEGFESMEQKIEEKMILARRASIVIYNSYYSELTPHILFSGCQAIDAAGYAEAPFRDLAARRNSQIVTALFHTLSLNAPSFEGVTPLAMRLEMIEGLSNSTIINDSYNSDINSLMIALDTLKSIASSRPTTVILSDIEQSGTPPIELYQHVASAIERAGVDRLVGIGANISSMRDLFSCETRFFASTEEFLSQITTDDYASRVILLKGSRESRFETISHALASKSHTTTLEVNLDAMRENLNYYRSHLAPHTKLIAMVKASSYGAGEREVAQMLQEQGVDYLAVAFADEGSRLRGGGITMPIIVLNADDGSFSQMIDSQLEPEIYSMRSLQDFARAVKSRGEQNYPIHIKIDSGMHRLGFTEAQIDELTQQLDSLRGVVRVASIFSHLATSDMGDAGREQTLSQIAHFERLSSKIEQEIGYPTLRHIANSAAITAYPEAHFDMCRLGIGLYGFGDEALRPVSTLKSRIVQIKQIDPAQRIGYGGEGTLPQGGRIATIPIGYADGVDRHLGNGAWSFLINGEQAPIVGRVCMDSCMVDISNIEDVNEGDSVTIFSEQKGHTAETMAAVLGTISYEVLTSISSRVKRIYIKE